MRKVRLGRTDLWVTKTSFGALPIQRIPESESTKILRRAYEAGINFFDTAQFYTDSEAKIGAALSDVRDKIVIATKSATDSAEFVQKNLENSLRMMKTDYIDIYQLHNPATLPNDDVWEVLIRAKEQGKIRYIGMTNHRIKIAWEAIESGLFDTLQFPFCLLSGEPEREIVSECEKRDIGFIAMKAMSGGLINNASAAVAFLNQYPTVVPIYGIQKMEELEEFLLLEEHPPVLDDTMKAEIERQKEGLSGDFCRGCGYCMPCPVGIEINQAARMSLMLGRAPYQGFVTKEWREKMDLIQNCIECGQCKAKCPYGLDTPNLLKRELERYDKLYAQLHTEEE
ncbi:MAG: aldo/keto reductase [Ruminococcaceae bacterium]|nr:aldo/keto reductase [Oscillospiraceae bacterium]